MYKVFKLTIWLLATVFLLHSCGKDTVDPIDPTPDPPEDMKEELVEGVDYFLPNIDLSNWKVTLPIGNPTEVEPPAILTLWY